MDNVRSALALWAEGRLTQDASKEAEAMRQIFAIARRAEEATQEPARLTCTPRPIPASTRVGLHEDVQDVRRWGLHIRGTIDGRGAQLYSSQGYRTIIRELAQEGRCSLRPAKTIGGHPAYWLTDEEAAIVRDHYRARYEGTA